MNDESRIHDVVAKLVPGGDGGLAHLSDSELLANTRGLVGKTNQVFAALLAHLAEVEARGLHRTRACASLYTYCIYELRFSEDAAARRAGAAKLVKRFPLLLGAIANGELHLTGLLMLGPHLTPENVVKVLGRAKFRTKKELAKLVRELHPLPLVPDLVQPLRPEPAPLRRPTWQEFVSSFAPAVRELPLGERPCDWANDENDAIERDAVNGASFPQAPARVEPTRAAIPSSELLSTALAVDPPQGVSADSTPFPHAPARVDPPPAVPGGSTAFPHAPARLEPLREPLPPVTGPQQYQVQFSTTEEHVQLIERAKSLLARQAPGKSLGELHLHAMKLLVAALEKQKFAVSERPRRAARSKSAPTSNAQSANDSLGAAQQAQSSAQPPKTASQQAHAEVPGRSGEPGRPEALHQRSRHVPAAVRRDVFERDEGRCSYVDERGERCRETRALELHHQQPFGKHGSHTASNLTLHCPAHNALAAELDFGRQHMAERRNPHRHASLASEERARSRE